MHIDNVVRFNLSERFELIHNREYTFFGNDSCLHHFFHGVLATLVLLGLYSPDFSKASSAYGVLKYEVIFIDGVDCVLVSTVSSKVAISH
jgi:hypothetical protein